MNRADGTADDVSKQQAQLSKLRSGARIMEPTLPVEFLFPKLGGSATYLGTVVQ